MLTISILLKFPPVFLRILDKFQALYLRLNACMRRLADLTLEEYYISLPLGIMRGCQVSHVCVESFINSNKRTFKVSGLHYL